MSKANSDWHVISSERHDEDGRVMVFDIEQADTPEAVRAEYRAGFAWGTKVTPDTNTIVYHFMETAYFDSVSECKAWLTAMAYTALYDNLKHAQPFIPEYQLQNLWLRSIYAITFDKK